MGRKKSKAPEKWTGVAAVKASLKGGNPMTVKEIAEASGLTGMTISRSIREMNRMVRTVYIAGWREIDACHRVPAFLLGNRPDAEKPEPISRAEHSRRQREKKKYRSGEDVEAQLAAELRREAEAALAQPAFRHWMDCALFGEYRVEA